MGRQGNGITSKAFVGTFHYMKACLRQCESSSEETGGMVLRLRVASAAPVGHRKEAAEGTITKSAVSVIVSADVARDSSLWRSRGTKEPPGAVSGGIFMPPPPARMDWAGADDAQMEIPGSGKGLSSDPREFSTAIPGKSSPAAGEVGIMSNLQAAFTPV